MARGNQGRDVYADERDCTLWLETLGQACEKTEGLRRVDGRAGAGVGAQGGPEGADSPGEEGQDQERGGENQRRRSLLVRPGRWGGGNGPRNSRVACLFR